MAHGVEYSSAVNHRVDFSAQDFRLRAEGFVAALDGRLVVGAEHGWVALVQGVHTDGHHWWIQIAPAHNDDTSVLLHCSGHARTEHLHAMLRQWERDAQPGLRLSVMC